MKATALHEKVNVNAFRTAYTKLLREDDDGWVNKALLLGKVREDTKKGQATIYRQFKEISDMFDNKKIGIRAYVRMKSKEEKE